MQLVFREVGLVSAMTCLSLPLHLGGGACGLKLLVYEALSLPLHLGGGACGLKLLVYEALSLPLHLGGGARIDPRA
jgi:hypothetical protein